MPNFITDGMQIPTRSDAVSPGSPATSDTPAANWNAVVGALNDFRSAVYAGIPITLGSNPPYITPQAYGARADGITDDAPAFAAAIAAMGTNASGFGSSAFGSLLWIPPGKYRLASPIRLNRSVHLFGAGTGGDFGSTQLIFDPGVDGIIIERPGAAVPSIQVNSAGATGPSAGGTGNGDWSIIENLQITTSGKSGLANGIRFEGRGIVRHVNISQFSNCGILMNTDPVYTNANNSGIYDVRITACSGDAVFIRGSNSNACTFINVDASVNTLWGFYDVSLLGNLYIMCHTGTNSGGPFYIDNASPGGTLLNCYVELDQGPAFIGPNSMSLGGTMVTGFGASTGLRIVTANDISPIRVSAAAGSTTVTHSVGKGNIGPYASVYTAVNKDDIGYSAGGWRDDLKAWTFAWLNAAPHMYVYSGFDPLGFRSGRTLNANFFLETLAGTAPFVRLLGSNGNPANTANNYIARAGDFIFNQNPATDIAGWVAKDNVGYGSPWAPTNGPYGPDDLITPSAPNGFVYRRTPASTGSFTGSVEPTWPLVIGQTVTDGGLVWECWGVVSPTNTLAPIYATPTPADSTAAPGAATQNTRIGRVAVSAGQTSVVITNNRITATSIVFAQIQAQHAGFYITSVVCTLNTITINFSIAAPANVPVAWKLES